MRSPSWRGELTDQVVGECSDVARETAGSDALQDLDNRCRDTLRLHVEQHLPDDAEDNGENEGPKGEKWHIITQ